MIPVFIAHDDGSFREHRQSEENYHSWSPKPFDSAESDETICGIRWIDLPNNRDSTTGEEWIDDKPWYYDHDRPDVVKCDECTNGLDSPN